jgi:thiamine-monophosphate kinase
MTLVHSESHLLEQIRRKISLPRRSPVIAGIGDDCAIYRPKGSPDDLLFTTDMLIEDVHFQSQTHSAEDVGWKALARGLSDIAAMGGEPRFFLVSLALTPRTNQAWVAGFYRGMLRLARRAGAILVGGDLGHGEKLLCDIVVGGSVPRGQALRRDGAKAGDAIYVSGRLGGAALGLAGARGAARKRHLRPEPRLALGRFLRERLHATAAMDLSDGLSLDLWRLCRASKLAASIEAPPRFPGATLDQSLHGGEDYELLFTVPAQTRVPSAHEGVRLTRIGIMRKGLPAAVLLGGKRLKPLGYDHFRTGC